MLLFGSQALNFERVTKLYKASNLDTPQTCKEQTTEEHNVQSSLDNTQKSNLNFSVLRNCSSGFLTSRTNCLRRSPSNTSLNSSGSQSEQQAF